MDRRPVRPLRPDPGAPSHPDGVWPLSVPAVAQVLREGLELPAGATVLVGENGSGKSSSSAAREPPAGPTSSATRPCHGLYSYLEDHRSPHRPEPRFHEMSHGDGFLSLLGERATRPEFYLLDEPDAALSFTGTLSLVVRLAEPVAGGAQVVVATHSPVLAALPGAHLLEVGSWGLRATRWADLELTASWRQFLDDPASFLRHLT